MRKPVVLVILDGWGIPDNDEASAIDRANLAVFRDLLGEWPNSRLKADGEAVGLEPGQMGDSNVGHLTIGSGRTVYQDLVRINRALRSGTFYTNPALIHAMQNARDKGSSLHLMGLLSDGGVHSHQDHCFALLEMARKHGLNKVYVHCFLDGRDTPPKSAEKSIEALQNVFAREGVGEVATIIGRYYAMDRDGRWERTQAAYDALVAGQGIYASSAYAGLNMAYDRDETDEFVQPTVIAKDASSAHTIKPHDSVIFFNFRADRARQITRAFIDCDLTRVNRPLGCFPLCFVAMAQYDEHYTIPVAFGPQYITDTFSEVVSKAGLRQLKLAETEKYAHVTFFFNGMVEEPFPGEDRILVPSPTVPTYDLMPEMSAREIAAEAIKGIASGYDCLIVNFANADMVGHTGHMHAAVKAVETVDEMLGTIIRAVLDAKGAALIVSDHGNAEKMIDADGEPHTAHTANLVPCILVDLMRRAATLRDGTLADVAPTLLTLLGLDTPAQMTGSSLILEQAILQGGQTVEHDSRRQGARGT